MQLSFFLGSSVVDFVQQTNTYVNFGFVLLAQKDAKAEPHIQMELLANREKYKKCKEAWDHGGVRKGLHFWSHSWPESTLFMSQISPKQYWITRKRASVFKHFNLIFS